MYSTFDVKPLGGRQESLAFNSAIEHIDLSAVCQALVKWGPQRTYILAGEAKYNQIVYAVIRVSIKV